MKKKIAIVTSTRADWGLLSPLARLLKNDPRADLIIVATNMHLDPRLGMTVNEVVSDGFTVDYRVEMTPEGDAPEQIALAMSRCTAGFASVFAQAKPDMIVILGDRYEMLAVASVATVMSIPIAHISGGEITEGAFDDNIRHAISKLSSLHFATTDEHRNRLIAMGEQPSTVVNAGALGVYNILNTPLLSRSELEDSLGFALHSPTLLVTYHPATNDSEDPLKRFGDLLTALDRFPECEILFTYPNNDPRGSGIVEMIEKYAATNKGRVNVVPSLGRVRYLSALQFVDAVVGNSSSGVVEVPSAGIPTVDVGIRQRGRAAADSVIHCGDQPDEIADAISLALSPEWREHCRKTSNPYANPRTAEIIAETLLSANPDDLLPKRFHDTPAAQMP